MIPTYFAVLVFACAWRARGPQLVAALMLFCLFGAAAAISLPALGGTPISPALLMLPFLVIGAVRLHGLDDFAVTLYYPRAGFWLLLLVAWAVASAVFLPRVFQGDVWVRAIDRGSSALGVPLIPLRPISSNLTQAGYAIAGLFTFCAVSALLPLDRGLRTFRNAVLLLAGLNGLAALLNLAELRLGLPSLLQFTRNAGYAIMEGGEIGGLTRISGTFAEASAFSSFTLPLFAFVFRLWIDRQATRYSGWLTLLSLGLLLASTSTTAYGALLLYTTWLAGVLALRGLRHGRSPVFGATAAVIWAALVTASVMLLMAPHLVERISDFFQLTVVRKFESSSGLERSSWNAQAWGNFLDTYGIGVGLGSARASSFILVLLSNVGVVGAVLFATFLFQVFQASPPQDGGAFDRSSAAVASAARNAMVAALIAKSISGTIFDLGIAFYAFSAVAAIPSSSRKSHKTARETHHGWT